MPKMVAVYSFRRYDISTDQNRGRPVKGTREAITRATAEIIKGTEEMVEESCLDKAGYYRPSS